MNKHKGMSQTLALIVAASVLMMTALTVIFLAQGSLGDFGETTGQQACLNAISAQCEAGVSVIDAPSTCYDSENNLIEGVQQNTEGDIPATLDADATYTCPDHTANQ